MAIHSIIITVTQSDLLETQSDCCKRTPLDLSIYLLITHKDVGFVVIKSHQSKT